MIDFNCTLATRLYIDALYIPLHSVYLFYLLYFIYAVLIINIICIYIYITI